MSSAKALIAVASQIRSGTTEDSVHDLAMLRGQVRTLPFPEAVAQCAEDVGHLKSGPTHLLARLLDRFMPSEVDT
jgi:hypothetical protein